jgi:hypothetical protein
MSSEINPKVRIEPCDNGFVVTTVSLPDNKITAKQVFTSLDKLLDYIENLYDDLK